MTEQLKVYWVHDIYPNKDGSVSCWCKVVYEEDGKEKCEDNGITFLDLSDALAFRNLVNENIDPYIVGVDNED